MLQEPITNPPPWDRNRASAIPLQGPPSHPLPLPPRSPNNPFTTNPLSRPGISARLSAVTAFARHASRSPSPSVPPLDDHLTHHMVDIQSSHPEPPTRTSSSARPSSRRALTAALELAQEAVRLDTTNDDPIGAIHAYSRSVALLSEVMERVMRGEDTSDTGRRRGGRRRSVVAKEEEVRRLKSIHDTYADRMNILSDIYSIDPNNPEAPPTQERQSNSSDDESHLPSLTEASSGSTELTTESVTDESFDGTEFIGSAMLAPSRDSTSTPDSSRTGSDHTFTTDNSSLPEFEMVNSLPEFDMVNPPSLQQSGPILPPPVASGHPFNPAGPSAGPRTSVLPPPRPPPSGPLPTRPRNGSTSVLPPLAPPPRVAPPPPPNPPAIIEPSEPSRASSLLPVTSTRPRGNSSAHKRTGSGSNRLEALQEEPDVRQSARHLGTGHSATSSIYFRQPHDPVPHPRQHTVDENGYRAAITRPPSQYLVAPQANPPPPRKETPPLPPIPTSSTPPPPPRTASPSSATPHASPMTPRGNSFSQPHPFSIQDPPAHVSRARGISTPTLRSDGYTQPAQLIINTNPSAGTISQRRSKSSTGTLSSQSSSHSSPPGTAVPQPGAGGMSPPSNPQPVSRLTASSLPASTASSLGIGRSRSSSQPPRPVLLGANSSPSEFGVRPPGPSLNFANAGSLPRKISFPSRLNPAIQVSGPPNGVFQAPSASSYLPSSPLPTASPADPLRKPYHLMSLLRTTMTSKSGGYITRRLHVPHEVWSQGGAKLLNLPEKVRVVEVLSSALEEVLSASNEFTSGAGVIVAASAAGRKDVERWLTKLDEWGGACEGVVGSVGKKLGVGEGFGVKKSGGVTSWSGKVVRSFDRMTNGKNLDSPANYVLGLIKLFQQAQLLDEHTKALYGAPTLPLYASLPADLRSVLELKLKRSSEFFASVVLTFVVRDLSQLLDKYVKKGEKWLAE